MSEHDFCRSLLREARERARAEGFQVPQGLSALKSCDGKQYFIESKQNSPRDYAKGDCTYSAKAEWIHEQLDRMERDRKEEAAFLKTIAWG